MSSDDSSNVPAPSDRREAVREKAQRVRQRHARVGRLRLAALSISGVAVVGAVVAAVVFAVSSSTSSPQLQPSGAVDGGFAVASVAGVSVLGGSVDESAPTESAAPQGDTTPTPVPTNRSSVDIRVYVDYLAPGAKQFETANAPQLSSWVTEGAATLSYHPVAMLTAKSNGTKYSLRAAGAAACVATYSPDTVFAFNHQLLLQQPEATSDGLSDETLADMAQAAGAAEPRQVRSCIENGEFMAWAKSATDAAVAGIPGTDGLTLTSTPMIFVNGELYQGALDDPKEFAQFVLTTASDAYYRTASPTPTPTPSS
ncbi:DsbA family protein [Microbacterium sp. RG1]|uniref:DsbA family protein n=1 Tax=Microbacterium sp. RG1 TaxID=2489212 RepID=UPI0010CA4B31|nr:thioredoxin domain-containing protein [Microbacterium sp. RG1]QCQ16648.1 protein-disulfide isomerase [Microbacterium sp. RG1]